MASKVEENDESGRKEEMLEEVVSNDGGVLRRRDVSRVRVCMGRNGTSRQALVGEKVGRTGAKGW